MKNLFKKIIVALDGSPNSEKALQTALAFGQTQNAKLFLIHVVKEVHPQFAAGGVAISISELNSALRENGEQILRDAEDEAEKAQIPCRTRIVSGDPAEKILFAAKEEEADLILIGSRGLGTFKEWMLGSVSHKVIQLAQCPVFVIK